MPTSKFPGEIDITGGRSELTRRELEILHFIALGFTTPEIGLILSIGKETVKSHTKTMFAKTRTRSRAHLVTVSWIEGMLTIPTLESTKDRFQQFPQRFELDRKRRRVVQ